jgi:hypothetical protein
MIRAGESGFDLLPLARARGGPRNRFDLVNYNTRVCRPEDGFLVIAIVHGPDEHMGFLKSDLVAPAASCPLYLEWHESGEYDHWAGSFGPFLALFQPKRPALDADLPREMRRVQSARSALGAPVSSPAPGARAGRDDLTRRIGYGVKTGPSNCCNC